MLSFSLSSLQACPPLIQVLKSLAPAPGSDPKARMVLSLTSDAPHFVRCKASEEYVCDSACIRWTSANIHSHTLAVAETNGELLNFCSGVLLLEIINPPNISILAMQGLPSAKTAL